jgi:hypothetical protein
MEKTRTAQGLSVTVNIIDKVYQTGRKATDQFIEKMPIVFDDHYPNGIMSLSQMLKLFN